MINANTEQFEKVLGQALELQEKGKSIPEILSLFPEYKEELKEVFQAVQILAAEKERIAPPKELLTEIISRLSGESVTNRENSRYLYRGVTKGRSSILEEVFKETEFMLTKWKILLPIGIVAVIVLVFAATQFTGRKTSNSLSLNEIAKEQESVNNLGSEIDQYMSEETSLDEIDGAIEEVATGETSASSPKQDPFELALVQTESKAVGFDSGLDSFFSEETNLKEVDSALSDF